MTIRKFPAAIAILLMAVLMLASCNLGGNAGNSSPEAAATVAVRAMTQAVDSVGQTNGVSVSGNVYKMTSFKADDGTVINGTFEIDGSGNIVDAELELNIDSRVLYFVLSDGNGTDPQIKVDNKDIPESALPEPMTADEERAFRMFLAGFDEVQDDVMEAFEEAFEHLEDISGTPGEVPISHEKIEGTIKLGYERGDRDDIEVIGGDIRFTDFPLEGGYSSSVTGSYSFDVQDDDHEKAKMNIRIGTYSDDGINLRDVVINGSVEEHGDDRFFFEGIVSGKFSTRNISSSTISFDGRIDAYDDDWLSFPEYRLTINGRNVAIGRPDRPFR